MNWRANILLEGLTPDQLSSVESVLTYKEYASKETLIKEGEIGRFLYLICSGNVLICKDEIKISECAKDEVVGIMSLIDNGPRSATVVAGAEGVKGYVIDASGWQKLLHDHNPDISNKILKNYIKYEQGIVRKTNELTLRETRDRVFQESRRVLSARFFAQMALGLVIFTFLLSFLHERTVPFDSTFMSLGVLLVYGVWSVFYVKMSKLPLSDFGITMVNFNKAFRIVMKGTGVVLVLLIMVKWILITFYSDSFGNELIDIYKPEDDSSVVLIIILYSIHSVVQEFIARGCIQGGLHQFLQERGSVWMAIILAALMFASFHVIHNLKFALLTIPLGLFWGYYFYKERNLWAVSISHIIIGVVAIFVLNLVS